MSKSEKKAAKKAKKQRKAAKAAEKARRQAQLQADQAAAAAQLDLAARDASSFEAGVPATDAQLTNDEVEAAFAAGEQLIFGASDIPSQTTEQIVDELAQGLSSDDRTFLLVAASELRQRLTPKRFAHSISVARTAKRMAQAYGVDVSQATRAGLVHDWDKRYHGQELFDRAVELGLELGDDREHLEPLLHAETAQRALAIRFPQLEPQVLQAVGRHTSGAVDMQPLDIVVYVADMLEPLRTYQSLVPLRQLIGRVSLDQLFSACFKATVDNLVQNSRYLHPQTAAIWNQWVAVHRFKRLSGEVSPRPE